MREDTYDEWLAAIVRIHTRAALTSIIDEFLLRGLVHDVNYVLYHY